MSFPFSALRICESVAAPDPGAAVDAAERAGAFILVVAFHAEPLLRIPTLSYHEAHLIRGEYLLWESYIHSSDILINAIVAIIPLKPKIQNVL